MHNPQLVFFVMLSPALFLGCPLERAGGESAQHCPQQVSWAREHVVHIEQVASGTNEDGCQSSGKQELWSGHMQDFSLVEGVEKCE